MRKLEGLTFVLTGATGGIGGATALQLARPGVNIAICSIDKKQLDDLASKLEAKGAKVIARLVDMTNGKAVSAFMDEVFEVYKKFDVLINFAGLSITSTIDNFTEENYDLVMDVNVKSMFLGTKFFVEHVDEENGAMIINFGSMAAKRANAKSPHYCAAKAAVDMFSDGLAMQLKDKNIRVTAMNPGPADTTFFEGRIPKEKRTKFMKASTIAEVLEFIISSETNVVFHDLMFESFDFYKSK
ncbi:MAG: SDR family NAD(P)-dependent oxidoreductase [Sphaerochaetaceae bacterium]|nr:SDR family NAD(P)-dependent oxidoreductase [Sphaerochaetaceae bacterium]